MIFIFASANVIFVTRPYPAASPGFRFGGGQCRINTITLGGHGVAWALKHTVWWGAVSDQHNHVGWPWSGLGTEAHSSS